MEQFLFVKVDLGIIIVIKTLALIFLILVYALKLFLLMNFRLGKDIARAKGVMSRGITSSLTVNLRPWAMESSRKGFVGWLEFLVLHIGILVAIGTSFLIPYAPQVLQPAVIGLFMLLMGLGFLAAGARLAKKLMRPQLKIISSRDDYFCIFAITLFLLAGTLAMTGVRELITFFLVITAGLLFYVPFSKISHYLYWPFSRYFMGKHFGRRGIYL
jgi:hypothetical protein